ncbi:MAG: AAA family ATPase [Verrucomicrobiales bacterium]|nr:AAA family ATPase [Verrucomicrobiales bacterium]
MDKGAHFHRCDFQVHTPRDINWRGERPQTVEERKAYAKEFITACRTKGLHAVAITDHHDFGFFPYLREASHAETDETGMLFTEAERIKVFPGLELTLPVPCQALLLLDEDFEVHLLSSVLSRLGIAYNAAEEPVHLPTQRLDHLLTLDHVVKLLGEFEPTKGRFILLPNVGDGSDSVMREKFVAIYRNMSCVGGYTDKKQVEALKRGTLAKLDGHNLEFDFKAVGVFPTSDNRQRDFALLGAFSAWVKWSEPTAEALRQACLARKTRILHSPPQAPNVAIGRIEISNSRFLGPLSLEFNDQFNCLIGGRGTGKSTVLEYVRWALCDQAVLPGTTQEENGFFSKRLKLVENTLQPYEASVTVEVLKNGVRHVVRRKSHPHELLLKIGDQAMEPTTEGEIVSLLPIQGYSQKQLSGVGVRRSELLRFVESAGTSEQLANLENEARDVANDVRRAFQDVEEKRDSLTKSTHLQLNLSSLRQQAVALKQSLVGLTEDDQAVLKAHEAILAGQTAFRQWETDQQNALAAVQRSQRDLAALPSRLAPSANVAENDLILRAQTEAAKVFHGIRAHLDTAASALGPTSPEWEEFRELNAQWAAKCREHETKHREVQGRLSAQQQTLDEIKDVEQKISALESQLHEASLAAEGLTASEAAYTEKRREWEDKFSGRADILTERCELLTMRSDSWIRATLRRGVMGKRLEEQMSSQLQGSRIRDLGDKIMRLADSISNAPSPMVYWQEVLAELDSLSRSDKNVDSTPECPHLDSAGFNAGDQLKIAERISRQAWLEMSLIELEDQPVFEYRQREAEYIPFSEASAGQQATALLRVLLNQEGPPLLIDQPEDDLDNEVIHEIAELIGAAKQRRQLIFTSHNANLVVNGDADLVVAFGYRVAGEQSLGEVKAEGAIDQKAVRERITAVMEGGEKAFYLRKDKYGF